MADCGRAEDQAQAVLRVAGGLSQPWRSGVEPNQRRMYSHVSENVCILQKRISTQIDLPPQAPQSNVCFRTYDELICNRVIYRQPMVGQNDSHSARYVIGRYAWCRRGRGDGVSFQYILSAASTPAVPGSRLSFGGFVFPSKRLRDGSRLRVPDGIGLAYALDAFRACAIRSHLSLVRDDDARHCVSSCCFRRSYERRNVLGSLAGASTASPATMVARRYFKWVNWPERLRR